jgi:hypothetical protein
MFEAEEILERLSKGENLPVIATFCISNHGGVAIYYADSECVVARYFEGSAEICEVFYTENEDAEEEEDELVPVFEMGGMEVPLGECMMTR